MYRVPILVLSLAALASFRGVAAQSKESFDCFKIVDKTGNIRKPDDYLSMPSRPRSKWHSIRHRPCGGKRLLQDNGHRAAHGGEPAV